MKKSALLLAFLLVSTAGNVLAAPSDDLIEVVPSVKVSKQDEALLRDNHTLLMKNQELVKKVLTHEGLVPEDPVLPKLHLLSSNSVLALVNQMSYRALARKLSVEEPKEISASSGDAISNNHFHHFYNNSR